MSEKNKPRSNYTGYEMPLNVDPTGLDEGGEETTRRIAFQPSFEPTSSFEPPSVSLLTCEEANVQTYQPSKLASVNVTSIDPERRLWSLDTVPTLPEYHPLERTAVFVPDASPRDVSMRISDVLRQRSIESFYDDEKAKVRCTSAEGVDFRIRLYRGRGKFSHGIIVEVQRRFGTSNVFHNDTLAILDAAEGKTPCPPPTSRNIPLVSDSDDDYQPSATSSLQMVSKMLSHGGYDSFYLAFQTLQSLTDSTKIGATTARAVAQELFTSIDNDVGSIVLQSILDKRSEDEMYKLRSMAMLVLANSLEAVSGKIDLTLWEQLRPVLIQELRSANKNPRNAVQAARAIEQCLSKEHNVNEIHAALEFAKDEGSARYVALQHQAQRCLDMIV